MASITFSGQLDQAMNEAAAEGNKILFIPQQTVGEVLPGAASELVVESDGTYSITLAYNTYSIYHYSDVTKRRTLLATDIVVSSDTVVTTIPDLIGSTVPVTEDSVLAIQGYLTEANTAKEEAATSAETATEAADAIISPWADTADLAHEPSFDNFSKTDDMFIESYGQSLALGSHGDPVISTTQNYNNVMFASGVKRISGTDYSEFVDLVETLTGVYGETPVTSITNYLSENDDDYTSDGTRYIGSASGLGGQPIYNLNRGSNIYSYLMDRIQAAKDLSDADGRSFSVPVICWTQGEANYNGDTDYRSYVESLTNLHSDLLEDVTSVTGQDYLPYMVTYQMGSHRAYGEDTPTIALAIKEVCDNTEGFGIACPLYSFEHYTDNIHLINDSYYSLGQYYGKAAKDLMDYGEVQNCHIKSAVCNGYTIMVDVNVPVPPLVIDTDNVAEAIGYGFYIKSISQGLDSSNNLINMVTDVEVVNDTQLKITVDEEIPSDARLVYAHGRPVDTATSGPTTGPRGNIRDSQGETWNWTTPTNGTYRRGDNWLLVDDVVIEHLDPKDLFEDFDGDVIDLIESVHSDTPSLSISFNESGRLDYGVGNEYVSGLPVYGVDFTRSTASTVINKSGVLEILAADEMGIGDNGIWLHDAYTNIVEDSEDLSASSWATNTLTATGDQTTLAGSSKVAYAYETNLSSTDEYVGFSGTVSVDHCFASAFFKPLGSSVFGLRISLTGGTEDYGVVSYDADSGSLSLPSEFIDGGVISCADGWYCLWGVIENSGGNTGVDVRYAPHDFVSVSSGDSCYISGCSIVDSPVYLPYLTTSGATFTASATECTVPVKGNLPSPGKPFTIIFDTSINYELSSAEVVLDTTNMFARKQTSGALYGNRFVFFLGDEGGGNSRYLPLDEDFELDNARVVLTFNGSDTKSIYVNGDLEATSVVDGFLGFDYEDVISFGFKLYNQLKNVKILPYEASADEIKSWGSPK